MQGFAHAVVAGLVIFPGTVLAQSESDIAKADETIVAFKESDEGIANFFDSAHGYAVFPSVGKGAIGVGGAHGKGVVYEGGEVIGKTTLTQVTIGFQLGGQAYSEVIFFEDARTFGSLTAGTLEFAAQASAVALKSGASADAKYRSGVLVFTMAKGGLMYEASIGGQGFTFEPKEEEEGGS